MLNGVNVRTTRFYPLLSFFILFCVFSQIIPASAAQAAATPASDQVSLDMPGLPDEQNSLKNMQGSMVISLKKEDTTTQNPNTRSRHTISTVHIRKGTVLNNLERTEDASTGPKNLKRIEILDRNDTVLYAKTFGYQNLITVPMKMPGQPDDQVPSLVPDSETTVVLPYIEGGQKIRVIDEDGRTVDSVALEDSPIADQVSETLDQGISPPPVNPGSFNVLILSSGYSPSTISSFTTKANLVKQQLLNTAPFSSHSPSLSVNIYANTQDLGCSPGCYGIDRLMCCDSSKVVSAAEDSGSLYDEIIVIHNTALYAGGGMREGGTLSYKTNSYSSYCQVYDGPYTVPMALHEFGHSFGDLCDEYTYGSEGYSYSPCVNCRAGCSDWSSVSGTCIRSCDAKSDFFRPERSIMLDLSSPTIFNQASIKADYSPDGLEKRLAFFIGTAPAAPVAAFTGTPLSGTAPLDVTFTDTSRGSSITSRRWDFGDGNISSYTVSTNPVHRYTSAGTYTVNLTVTNAGGSDSLLQSNYITVTPAAEPSTSTKIGVFRNSSGTWYLDYLKTGEVGTIFQYGKSGDTPVTGDWNNDGKTEIGVVRNNNTWLLDNSGDGTYGAGDLVFTFGKSGDAYITGDWNADGKTEIGVVRNNNTWLLDANGNGTYGAGDLSYVFGKAGDVFVTGDWNADGKTEIGVVRNNNIWLLDNSGNGAYGAGDLAYTFGKTGDIFVTGDWNADGKTEIGVVRNANMWLLDNSGEGRYDTGDLTYTFGKSSDTYVTGKWR